jgi:hypothetical protein
MMLQKKKKKRTGSTRVEMAGRVFFSSVLETAYAEIIL